MNTVLAGSSLVLGGLISAVGLYHIALFFLRRQGVQNMYFGLVCLCYLLLCIGYARHLTTPLQGLPVIIRFQYVVQAFEIGFLVGFIHTYAIRRAATWGAFIRWMAWVLGIAITLTQPSYTVRDTYQTVYFQVGEQSLIMHHYLPGPLAMSLIILLFVAVIYIQINLFRPAKDVLPSTIRGLRYANFAYMVCMINDLCVASGKLSSVFLQMYGFLAYIAVGSVSLIRDARARVRMESLAREKMLQIENFLNLSPIGVIIWASQPDGRPVLEGANRAAEDMLGFPLNSLVGMDEEAFPPSLASNKLFLVSCQMARQDRPVDPIRVHSRNASVERVFECAPVSMQEQRVGIFITDVTLQEQLRAEIANNEQQRMKLLERITDGYFLYEADGDRFVEINSKCSALLGCPPEEIMRYDFRQFVTSEDKDRAVSVFRDVLRDKSEVFVRLKMQSLDGSIRDIEVSAHHIPCRGKSCVQGVLYDVTDRNRMMRRFAVSEEHAQRSLSHVVHDVIGQSIAGLNYLIDGVVDTLGTGGDGVLPVMTRVQQLAREAMTGVRNLARGIYPQELIQSDLAAALSRLVGSAKELFAVECYCDMIEPCVGIDRMASLNLYSIAREALFNAIKHSGTKRIDILLRDEGREVHMEIRDYGSGIPDKASRGDGMGLDIMQYRAGLCGAQLAIVAEGQGTIVKVTYAKQQS